MSMTLQNMTATTAKTPVTASAGGTGSMAAAGFNQALTYVMGSAGTAGTSATTSMAGQVSAGVMGSAASLLEMLQQIISGNQDNGEGSQGEKVGELMDDLLGKLEDMDASIVSDPNLMQSLQGWLVQVQQVLSGEGTEAQAEGTDAAQPAQSLTATLPAIAQQPETLRFAVADAVSQVVDKLQAVQSSTQQAEPKLEQLLNELQNVLQKSGESADGQASGGQSGKQQQPGTPFQVVAAQESQIVNNISAVQTEAAVESAEAVTSQTQHQEPVIVTAGQLAMKADSAPLTAAAPPPPIINAQNFSQEMGKFIVSKFDIQQLNGVSEAKIILNPEHLGQVDVKISIQDGQLIAQFITEKHGAKDLLEQQMAQLRSALQAQGLQVEKLEVTQSSSLQSDMYNGGQGFQPGSDQQSGRRSKSKEEQNDDAILTAELGNELNEWREERVNIRAASMTPYGSTYVAKA
ncbi:flagellar hook-length control protein FliK [Paenibacillus sp. Z6-24]